MDAPLSFEQLKAFTGYERPSDVIKWLDLNRIPYKIAKKAPVTTLSALNKAIIGDDDDEEIEFNV